MTPTASLTPDARAGAAPPATDDHDQANNDDYVMERGDSPSSNLASMFGALDVHRDVEVIPGTKNPLPGSEEGHEKIMEPRAEVRGERRPVASKPRPRPTGRKRMVQPEAANVATTPDSSNVNTHVRRADEDEDEDGVGAKALGQANNSTNQVPARSEPADSRTVFVPARQSDREGLLRVQSKGADEGGLSIFAFQPSRGSTAGCDQAVSTDARTARSN